MKLSFAFPLLACSLALAQSSPPPAPPSKAPLPAKDVVPEIPLTLKYAFVKAVARAEAQAAQVQAAQKSLDELNQVTTSAYQALTKFCGDGYTVVIGEDSEAACTVPVKK